jgi:PPOX class probable F420-dependent enzyme
VEELAMTTTESMTNELLAPFVDSYAMLLRTRRRDGTWVGTPVNVAVEGDHAFFRTFERSGKAKRIRNFPDVSVAPCTLRGRPTGPFVAARATLLHGDRDQHASRLIEQKHPILQGVLVPLAHRLQRQRTQHYEITAMVP